MSALPRVLAGVPASGTAGLAEHRDAYGPRPALGPHGSAELVATVEAAGLRGRGGAGFPAAVKLHAVLRARGEPVLVANGSEGEPASAKDRLLLGAVPHLVLDGAALAAEAIGAREAIVVAPDDGDVIDAVRAAIAERAAARTDGIRFRFASVPPATYLAGQETALINYLSGGPAIPTSSARRPTERGLDKRPTLVQNVETLAHLALLARHGADWFRAIGTAEEPGSALVTLSGDVPSPGVYEIALGTSAAAVVAAGGGDVRQCRALLVGGYFGAWVDARDAATLAIDDHDLRRHGAMLGTGVIAVLGMDACPVAETARVTRWLAEQGAGQCGPCANGLPAISDAIDRVASGIPYRGVGRDLERWCQAVRHRGACRHPDGVATFVSSALAVFAEEFADHARSGACAACAAPPVLPIPAPVAVG